MKNRTTYFKNLLSLVFLISVFAFSQNTIKILDPLILEVPNKKILQLGNRIKKTKNYFESNPKKGTEIGLKIKLRKESVHLLTFQTKFIGTKNTSKFDLLIYNSEDNKPAEILFTKQYQSPQNEELIQIDLEREKIILNNDFFVTLRWDETQKKQLKIPGSIFGKRSIYKTNENSKWKKTPLGGVQFQLTAKEAQ